MDFPDKFQILEPLLQGLTHEIRNPVQGILASADALRCRYEDDVAGSKLLDMIHRECLRIDQLCSDLLDLTRPVAMDRTKAQSLNRIIEETIRNFKQPGSVIQITTEIPESMHSLDLDPHSMRRAITAVIQNALESRQEAVAVRVAIEDLGNQLAIRIEDNGEGILPADLDHVLEPFFSTRPNKAGLGLSIAERIVRLHEGHFQIQSKAGAGTVVIMRLPAKP